MSELVPILAGLAAIIVLLAVAGVGFYAGYTEGVKDERNKQ